MFLAGSFEDGDINGDGVVDFADFRLFKDHPERVVGFDEGAGSAAANPEPASLLLVGIAALLCCGLGRRASRRRSESCLAAFVLIAAVLTCCEPVHAAEQDLLNDSLSFSGKTLNLRPYATMPAGFNNIIGMAYKPSDTRMFVPTEQGSIFVVNEDASGNVTPALWFNASAALQTATGRSMNFSGGQQGLQSVAFHPDFEKVGAPGYGKLYTTMLENRPGNPNDSAFFYLGNSGYGGGGADGVLVEWTYDHNSGQVDPNSYRELFRTNMPNYDHPIKQARFNPYAEPGDDDYGLLYLTHGDSNNQDSLNDDPQDRGDVLGKMLRINPLSPAPGVRYTVPTTNPYYSNSSPSPSGTAVLGEVYAYGFRNPHTFSFNTDDEGNIHILLGDIGRDNIEEVNLVVPGGNYGWTKREGTFVHRQGSNYPINPGPDDAGYYTGVTDLLDSEAAGGFGPDGNRYIYPVAQYDHNGPGVDEGDGYVSAAVASGFVIRNGSDPELHNQFIFNNFGGDTANYGGPVYHVDFDEVLNAVTQLDPGDDNRDHPDELTQAVLYRFHLAFDHDNNPNTAPQMFDDLNDVVGASRNDARYGEGISGEMYLSSKQGGIYLVTNTVPDNRLTLTVDRGTGEMTITNSTGSNIEVDRVSVYSPTGSLEPARFDGLQAGWTVSAANNERSLTQSSDAGSFELTDVNSAFLGAPHEPQLLVFGEPAGEDVQFVFTTPGPGGRDFVGDVVYVGESQIFNTIVMSVNLATGEAVLLNRTPFAQEVEGYTITSPTGSLNSGEWDSFEAQGVDDGDWLASPPRDDNTRLTEFQEDGTTTFDDQSPYSLGNVFQDGVNQDLTFEFLLAGEGTLREGRVVYFLPGDYNGDLVVDAADFTLWRDTLGQEGYRMAADGDGDLVVGTSDYNVWKSHFGLSLAGAGAGSVGGTAVPEPASWALAAVAAIACVACTRRVPLLTC
jgi:glucose/arabinose dehydrogenase